MKVLKLSSATALVALTLSALTIVISSGNAASESFAYGKKGIDTSLASIGSFALLPPIDENGGGGGGGGGTPPTGGNTEPQYRLLPSLKFEDAWYSYPFSGTTGTVVEAVAYFEQNVGGTWQRVNAQNLNIDCFVNGSFRDRDSESNA